MVKLIYFKIFKILALLNFSKAKVFYKDIFFLQGLGICSNNIGNLHFENKRYEDAIKEYLESMLYLRIDYSNTFNKRNENILDVQFEEKDLFKNIVNTKKRSKSLIRIKRQSQENFNLLTKIFG